MARLNATKIMLAGCNCVLQPMLFTYLLNVTCSLSIELGKISQELAHLEHKSTMLRFRFNIMQCCFL